MLVAVTSMSYFISISWADAPQPRGSLQVTALCAESKGEKVTPVAPQPMTNALDKASLARGITKSLALKSKCSRQRPAGLRRAKCRKRWKDTVKRRAEKLSARTSRSKMRRKRPGRRENAAKSSISMVGGSSDVVEKLLPVACHAQACTKYRQKRQGHCRAHDFRDVL